MNRRARVIPVLLSNGSGLVKTKRFAPAVYVGDAINAVRIFNEKQADELILLDIQASKRGRGPDFEMVRDIASECFMPLAYGGGVRTLEDAFTLMQCGVEKIIVNRAFRDNPKLIGEISRALGASSTVVSLDVHKPLLGRWQVFAHETGRGTGEPLGQALARAEQSGAGEVMITVVNREGLRQGPDESVAREAASAACIPVIYNGGISSLADIQAVLAAGASAVAVGAMFVLHGKHDAVLISYPSEAQVDGLTYPSAQRQVS